MTEPSPHSSDPLKRTSAITEDPMAILRTIVEAERTTSPHALAAQTLGKVFGANAEALEENMAEAAKAVNGGSLVGVEGTLASQATTLNALFHRLTQVAFEKPRSAAEFDGWFKLALRAQLQSAKTFEILANLKQGPRVVVTGQLNSAQQQVINNGAGPARIVEARESKPATQRRKRPSALPPISDHLPDAVVNFAPIKSHAPLDH